MEKVAIELINLGADLSTKDKHKNSALMLACEKKMNNIAMKIAEIDPKLIHEKNILGENSIQICQKLKNEELALYLLKFSVDRPESRRSKNKMINI